MQIEIVHCEKSIAIAGLCNRRGRGDKRERSLAETLESSSVQNLIGSTGIFAYLLAGSISNWSRSALANRPPARRLPTETNARRQEGEQ